MNSPSLSPCSPPGARLRRSPCLTWMTVSGCLEYLNGHGGGAGKPRQEHSPQCNQDSNGSFGNCRVGTRMGVVGSLCPQRVALGQAACPRVAVHRDSLHGCVYTKGAVPLAVLVWLSPWRCATRAVPTWPSSYGHHYGAIPIWLSPCSCPHGAVPLGRSLCGCPNGTVPPWMSPQGCPHVVVPMELCHQGCPHAIVPMKPSH